SDETGPSKHNDHMIPIDWTKTYTSARRKTGRVFTTTMGSAQNISNEAFRRLLVNASYWALRMERQIPSHSNVDLVGPYHPLPFGFGGFKKGLKPSEMELP